MGDRIKKQPRKGWFWRQVKLAEKEAKKWPKWMKS